MTDFSKKNGRRTQSLILEIREFCPTPIDHDHDLWFALTQHSILISNFIFERTRKENERKIQQWFCSYNLIESLERKSQDYTRHYFLPQQFTKLPSFRRKFLVPRGKIFPRPFCSKHCSILMIFTIMKKQGRLHPLIVYDTTGGVCA